MLKRLGIVAGASTALLLTTTAPAFAADGAVVSGPATAAVGSTVQMSVVYTIDDVATVSPLTSVELRASLSAAGPSTPTGGTFAANPTTGVTCPPVTDEGTALRSQCVWTLPASGPASVTVTYGVGVASTATVGETWTVGAALYDQAGSGNIIGGAVPGFADITITAAPTASPSPTASTAPTASASPSSAPVPTAVPAGAAPGESGTTPLLWGLALVAGTATLIGGGRFVARQRR